MILWDCERCGDGMLPEEARYIEEDCEYICPACVEAIQDEIAEEASRA